MIYLVGPGGAGKTTTGDLLGERLGISFVDLDERFMATVGDIGTYIEERGYLTYAARNVELYSEIATANLGDLVLALSSGFMTYPLDVHRGYSRYREAIASSPTTFVLLPTLDFEECVAEIVRRQVRRTFGRSALREEEVIRERFWLYAGLSARKVQTMRAPEMVVDELAVVLAAQLGAALDRSATPRDGERQGR